MRLYFIIGTLLLAFTASAGTKLGKLEQDRSQLKKELLLLENAKGNLLGKDSKKVLQEKVKISEQIIALDNEIFNALKKNSTAAVKAKKEFKSSEEAQISLIRENEFLSSKVHELSSDYLTLLLALITALVFLITSVAYILYSKFSRKEEELEYFEEPQFI